mmetsp:Transcript_37600/g.87920  ORF Transcript_37600/g.87920 Transcript_37600/m.87920 type:complete len:252 (-) Transcript_37600:300-1055(-)
MELSLSESHTSSLARSSIELLASEISEQIHGFHINTTFEAFAPGPAGQAVKLLDTERYAQMHVVWKEGALSNLLGVRAMLGFAIVSYNGAPFTPLRSIVDKSGTPPTFLASFKGEQITTTKVLELSQMHKNHANGGFFRVQVELVTGDGSRFGTTATSDVFCTSTKAGRRDRAGTKRPRGLTLLGAVSEAGVAEREEMARHEDDTYDLIAALQGRVAALEANHDALEAMLNMRGEGDERCERCGENIYNSP